MLTVLIKRPHLNFSHLLTHEVFCMPSVGDLQSNKWNKTKEWTISNAHFMSSSLCLSLMLYWYNYSSSAHVPSATDQERMDGCLTTPLPHLEDMASGAALPSFPRWEGCCQEGSFCRTTYSHKYSDMLFWSTRQVSHMISWGFYLSFIRNMHTMLPGLAHFLYYDVLDQNDLFLKLPP